LDDAMSMDDDLDDTNKDVEDIIMQAELKVN
jgi:hypothetical protein